MEVERVKRGRCIGCLERMGADVPAVHPQGQLCAYHLDVKLSNLFPLSALAVEHFFYKSPLLARLHEAQA